MYFKLIQHEQIWNAYSICFVFWSRFVLSDSLRRQTWTFVYYLTILFATSRSSMRKWFKFVSHGKNLKCILSILRLVFWPRLVLPACLRISNKVTMNIVCIRRISNEVSMNSEHSKKFQICSTRKKFEMYFLYSLSRLLASFGAACLSSYVKWSFSEYHLHSSYFKWGFDKYIFSFHLKARTENKNVQICSASIKFDTIFSLWAMRYYFTRFLWAMVYYSTRLYASRLHSMDLNIVKYS